LAKYCLLYISSFLQNYHFQVCVDMKFRQNSYFYEKFLEVHSELFEKSNCQELFMGNVIYFWENFVIFEKFCFIKLRLISYYNFLTFGQYFIFFNFTKYFWLMNFVKKSQETDVKIANRKRHDHSTSTVVFCEI
jgi:hypothetical protein